MLKFTVDSVKGKVINPGTINERRIKLFASPYSPAKRDAYGCGMALIDPGQVHEEHAHPDSEELIFVVQGTGTGRIAGQEVQVQPGDLIAIEKGEPHQFRNTGAAPAALDLLAARAGKEVLRRLTKTIPENRRRSLC